MARLLFWIVLAFIVAYAWRSAGRRRDVSTRPPADGSGAAEPMVACAVCGLNVPRSEALSRGALHYCSEDHLRLGRS